MLIMWQENLKKKIVEKTKTAKDPIFKNDDNSYRVMKLGTMLDYSMKICQAIYLFPYYL